jgi:IS5 family transposase
MDSSLDGTTLQLRGAAHSSADRPLCTRQAVQTHEEGVAHAALGVSRVVRDVEGQVGRASDSGRAALWNSLPVRSGSVEEARGQEQALRAACTGRRTPSHRKGSDAVRIWRGGVDYDDPQGSPVVGARSTPGNSYDGHTLAEALKQVAILSDVCPEVAILDYGYKGIAIDDVKISALA